MTDFTAPGVTDAATAPRASSPAPDPDLGGREVGAEVNDLDALREELTAVAEAEDKPDAADPLTTVIDVPKRPGYAIRCRLDFTGQDLELLRRQSKDKRFSDGLDGVKVSSLLLGLTTTAILRNGHPVLNDGEPVTFATPEFQRVYGAGKVDDTVRKFFVLEGHVDSAARRLTNEAGWNDDLSPTQ